jgi:hypothetical protein
VYEQWQPPQLPSGVLLDYCKETTVAQQVSGVLLHRAAATVMGQQVLEMGCAA